MQEMRDKKATRHLENKKQNDRKKSHHISNYFKYKWIELSNQKTVGKKIKTYDATISYLQETHFRSKDTNRLKTNG